MEYTTKIKPNPPDYMRKEKREEKNKRKRRKKAPEEGLDSGELGGGIELGGAGELDDGGFLTVGDPRCRPTAVRLSWTTVGSSSWVTYAVDPRLARVWPAWVWPAWIWPATVSGDFIF
jgi:hypothetical protein